MPGRGRRAEGPPPTRSLVWAKTFPQPTGGQQHRSHRWGPFCRRGKQRQSKKAPRRYGLSPWIQLCLKPRDLDSGAQFLVCAPPALWSLLPAQVSSSPFEWTWTTTAHPQQAPGDPHGEESPSGLEMQEAHSPAVSAGRAPSAARTAGTCPGPTVHRASGWPHPCLMGPRPPCVGDGPALEAAAGQGGWLPAGPRNEWLLQEHRDRGPVVSVMPRPLPCGVPAEAAQLSGPRPCLALRAPAPPGPPLIRRGKHLEFRRAPQPAAPPRANSAQVPTVSALARRPLPQLSTCRAPGTVLPAGGGLRLCVRAGRGPTCWAAGACGKPRGKFPAQRPYA